MSALRIPAVLSFLAALVLLSGCVGNQLRHSEISTFAADPWEYPIKPGASRAQGHELLGSATRSTRELEEYPLSGVTVYFENNNDQVTKLGFDGNAIGIYSTSLLEAPIPSDRRLVFGLTGHSDEAEFRRVLGIPKREIQEGASARRELHCIWKREGYVVDALFLSVDRHSQEKTYPAGSLLWFDVYRGL
jgi:hypothetical protein